jgi:hypothetical protein
MLNSKDVLSGISTDTLQNYEILTYNCLNISQGCKNRSLLVAMATKFCTVAPHI